MRDCWAQTFQKWSHVMGLLYKGSKLLNTILGEWNRKHHCTDMQIQHIVWRYTDGKSRVERAKQMAVSRFVYLCVRVCVSRGGASAHSGCHGSKNVSMRYALLASISGVLPVIFMLFFFFFLAAQIPWKIKRVELCTYRAMSQTAVLWNQRRAMCPTIPCSAWRWTALRWVLESFFDFASISPEIFERSVVLVSWKELSWNLWYTWTI